MIDKLIDLLIPPPKRVFDELAWMEFEDENNLKFPSDFKKFISIYGCGAIDDFVWILDPLSNNINLNFDKSRYFIETYALMSQDFPSDYSRPKYPVEGSFIPWAVTDNGETFVWLVDGEPNSWRVAIHSSDQGDEEVYRFGCVEFIVKLLSREISSQILPTQFPAANLDRHFFTPVD